MYLNQAANQPTQDELLESITDGKDDLGLDAYFIDDAESTVYLFQSKYRSAPGSLKMNELVGLLDVPKRLVSHELLRDANQKIADFARPLRRCLSEGYVIQVVYLTTMHATKPVHDRANSWSSEPLILSLAAKSVDVEHSAVVCDLNSLVDFMDSFENVRDISLKLEMSPDGFHQTSSGGFKCLIGTLDLTDLVEIFDQYKYRIFRHNPRGPLGSNIVNKGIRQTLTDPNQRELFQLMNNGLSAVCKSFTTPVIDSGRALIHVDDLQIVNGCQTTFTAWNHWRRFGELGNAQITIKLVEDPSSNLRHFISAASNKQSQMKPWDFLFDRPEQLRLQREFRSLDPPVFYELRRGEYKHMADGNPGEYVTIKDIAQTTWAFMGAPGEAKDKIRDIPESPTSEGGVYGQVFYDGVEAERLRLPWTIYQRIQSEWRKYAERTGNKGDEREHGRLHVLWLIGRSLVKQFGQTHYRDIPTRRIQELTATMDEWFNELHEIAVESLSYVVDLETERATESDSSLQLRPLFRSPVKYHLFERRHDKLLSRLAEKQRSFSSAA